MWIALLHATCFMLTYMLLVRLHTSNAAVLQACQLMFCDHSQANILVRSDPKTSQKSSLIPKTHQLTQPHGKMLTQDEQRELDLKLVRAVEDMNVELVEVVLKMGANANFCYPDPVSSLLLQRASFAIDEVKCYIVNIQAANIQALLSTCRHHCFQGMFVFAVRDLWCAMPVQSGQHTCS